VNNREWVRFGRMVAASYVGFGAETLAICSELPNEKTCS